MNRPEVISNVSSGRSSVWEGAATQTPERVRQPNICQNCCRNGIKIKEFGLEGHPQRPLGFATGLRNKRATYLVLKEISTRKASCYILWTQIKVRTAHVSLISPYFSVLELKGDNKHQSFFMSFLLSGILTQTTLG